MSRIGEEFCYRLSHYLLSSKKLGRYDSMSKISESEADFARWRDETLQKSLDPFPNLSIEHKVVADFGCGAGELSFLAKQLGAKRSTESI